jgi:hypothetical protein
MRPARNQQRPIPQSQLRLRSGEADAAQLRAWRALWQRLLSDNSPCHGAQASAEHTSAPSAAGTPEEAHSG